MIANTTSAGRSHEIWAAIRSLERLRDKCARKIRDLDKEDGLRIQRFRAEKAQRIRRAEELREEMRREIRARMRREHMYLFERHGIPGKAVAPPPGLPPGAEAEIAAKADFIARSEAAAEVSIGGGGEIVTSAPGGLEIIV